MFCLFCPFLMVFDLFLFFFFPSLPLFVFTVCLSVCLSVWLRCLSRSHSHILNSHLASVTNHTLNKTDHQPNMPQTKTVYVQTWSPTPKWVQMRSLLFLPAYGICSVFCTYTNKFWKFYLYLKNQNKIAQICVLPILTRQPDRHECTPPKQKIYFWAFDLLRGPPKNLLMSAQAWKTARHFQQKSKPQIFKINNFKQIRPSPNTISWAYSLDTIFAPPSSQNLFL